MPFKILLAACASIFSVLATPLAFAQTAYFSFEGDFNAGGDQHNFTFDLSRSVTSNEVLRFETFANGGGTNSAGDVIASGGIDSDLRLLDSNNTVIGRNDDADFTGALDSLLSWPGVAPAPRNPFIELPSPLVAGGYSLNLTEFNNDQAGPWAIDLVGPADAITLTEPSPAGTSTIDSLKFGTTGSGDSAAVFLAAGGVFAAPVGTVEVTGPLVVAETGQARMFLDSGDSVGSSSGVIGNEFGSTGVVTVIGTDASGNGAIWRNSGDLVIGYDGNGTLNIDVGGRVTNRAATLGEGRGSSVNRVTVSGPDAMGNPSTWTNTGALRIGSLGSDSRLTIEGGGQVSSNSGSLGADIDDQSSVVVSGADVRGNASTWSMTDKLSVGGGGSDASLTIQGGAHVSNQDSQIDNSQNGAINRVTVTGAGSTWTSRGRLLISDIGNRDAELLVSSGGRATGANAEIGFVPSQANPGLAGGIATVTGASSIWSLTGNLDIATSAGSIGATGDGTLNVSNGGTVTVGGATTIGANGAVNLSGGSLTANGGLDNSAGGTLTHSDGTLTVTGGAFKPNPNVTDNYAIDSGSSPSQLPKLILGTGSSLQAGMLTVAGTGIGELTIQQGASVTTQSASVGTGSTTVGAGRLAVTGNDGSGSRSTLTNDNDFVVGAVGSGLGDVSVSSGAKVSSRLVSIVNGGIAIRGSDADGVPSSLEVTERLRLTGGVADLDLEAGGRVTAASVTVGSEDSDVTVVGVSSNGSRSTLTVTNGLDIAVATAERGDLDILDGGLVSSGTVRLGTADQSQARARVTSTSATSTWMIQGDLTIGGSSSTAASVDVGVGGLVKVSGRTDLGAVSAVNLNGGRFEFGALSFVDYEKINGVSGALAGSVDGIVLNGVNNINSVAAVPAISNIAPEVDVSGVSASSYTNRGLVFGAGSLNVGFTNDTTGEIQVITGQQMRFTSAAAFGNAGQITLAGGQVEFTQGFTNQAGGLVLGFGGLRADGGTMNDGTMAFSATAAVIGDVTNNATGVISSSGGTTMFFDDVVNNGEVRTNANSFTVYFGSYSGNGDTGTGTVIMEGDLKPGSSPGLMAFGGDLVLGDQSTTEIELGGLTPGTESDQITVVDELALDGDLTISLLPGYTPTLGDTFDLLTAASISGVFDSITLPAASFELIYSATRVQLIATSALSGDYNNDGVVDAADYTVWRDSLNAPAGSLLNDDVGGVIGTAQYDAWRANFGATLPASSTAVPEPSGIAMLSLGGLLVARHRALTAQPRSTLLEEDR